MLPAPSSLAEGVRLLGGVALALSFVLLYQQRPRAMVRAYAAQAWAAAAVAAWHGWHRDGADGASVAAALLAACSGILAPVALRRAAAMGAWRALRLDARTTAAAAASVASDATAADIAGAAPQPGVFASMALGVAVVAVAVLAIQPAASLLPTPAGPGTTREDLAFALAIVLLGMLAVASRRSALAQVAGLLSMGNGLVIGAAGLGGSTALAAASASLLVSAAVAAAPAVLGTPVLKAAESSGASAAGSKGEGPQPHQHAP